MEQGHETFKFYRFIADSSSPGYADTLMAALVMVASELDNYVLPAIAARSVSIVTDPTEITICIGHNEDTEDTWIVDFAVIKLDSARPEESMAEAKVEGTVICHDLFRIPGEPDSLYVLFMVHK